MTPPQPIHKGSNTKAILFIAIVAIVMICGMLTVCLAPFGLFAWLISSVETSPTMHLAATLSHLP